MEIEWSRLKAAEIAALARQDAVVIAPIGATEQHGPHLPSMVDWRCAQEVAQRAARLMQPKRPVVVTPTMPFGMSEHHMSLSGTITLDYATMAALVGCVVEFGDPPRLQAHLRPQRPWREHGGAAHHRHRADGQAPPAARHRHLLGHRRGADRGAARPADGAAACLRGRDLDDHGAGAGAGGSTRSCRRCTGPTCPGFRRSPASTRRSTAGASCRAARRTA